MTATTQRPDRTARPAKGRETRLSGMLCGGGSTQSGSQTDTVPEELLLRDRDTQIHAGDRNPSPTLGRSRGPTPGKRFLIKAEMPQGVPKPPPNGAERSLKLEPSVRPSILPGWLHRPRQPHPQGQAGPGWGGSR